MLLTFCLSRLHNSVSSISLRNQHLLIFRGKPPKPKTQTTTPWKQRLQFFFDLEGARDRKAIANYTDRFQRALLRQLTGKPHRTDDVKSIYRNILC